VSQSRTQARRFQVRDHADEARVQKKRGRQVRQKNRSGGEEAAQKRKRRRTGGRSRGTFLALSLLRKFAAGNGSELQQLQKQYSILHSYGNDFVVCLLRFCRVLICRAAIL
jgi:hypothetical protein